MSDNPSRAERVVAECVVETQAQLVHMREDLETIGGKLWFLQDWADGHHLELAQPLEDALNATVMLTVDVHRVLRRLAERLPVGDLDYNADHRLPSHNITLRDLDDV